MSDDAAAARDAQRLAMALTTAVAHHTPEMGDLLREVAGQPLAVLALATSVTGLLTQETRWADLQAVVDELELQHWTTRLRPAQVLDLLRTVVEGRQSVGLEQRLQSFAVATAALMDGDAR
jgi:hypothetical protein